MERGSFAKIAIAVVGVLLFMQFGMPLLCGAKNTTRQPLTIVDSRKPEPRLPEETCTLDGDRFTAEFSSHGASARHVLMRGKKYTTEAGGSAPIDLVTTTLEERMPLRTDFVLPGGQNPQVEFNDLDYKVIKREAGLCVFEHASEATRITKAYRLGDKPFTIALDIKLENLAKEPRKHRLAVEQTSWRLLKETEGSLGRTADFLTEVAAKTDTTVDRVHPSDFDPDDFKDENFTPEKWRRTPGDPTFVSVSSSYFASAIVPITGEGKPAAESQIEEIWSPGRFTDKTKDPDYGHVYRGRLAWPELELAPGASASYAVLAYMGPKERDVLAVAGHGLGDLIDLGWFSPIATRLVWYVNLLYRFVGSWGWAIVLLTLSARILLLPLTYLQVRSGIAMRRLKPEMDTITAKFKDDAVQRQLATQELWRKNKLASPFVGCLPGLLQMPIWIALYTALQTAVELYHVPFGPFIPDLSAPGKYFIIPIVLGGASFVQQKLMPPTGGDPAQQKMMLYMMPAIFTVMMLFLPAGLGVYMLTNTALNIVQQLVVNTASDGRGAIGVRDIEVREKSNKTSGDAPRAAAGSPQGEAKRVLTPGSALGKGKSRGRA